MPDMDEVDWIVAQLKRPDKSGVGLAKALDLNPSAISRIKNRERRLHLPELRKACAYFGEPVPAEVFDGLMEPSAPDQQQDIDLIWIAVEAAFTAVYGDPQIGDRIVRAIQKALAFPLDASDGTPPEKALLLLTKVFLAQAFDRMLEEGREVHEPLHRLAHKLDDP